MTTNIGLNIEMATVARPDLLSQHLSTLKPAWCLTFSVKDALTIQAATGGEVIVRLFPDGGVNPDLTADEWMKKYQNVADNKLWIEATNEDGLQIDWLTNPQKGILPAALKRGWKICAPALQTGNPTGDPAQITAAWASARPFFDLLAQYPNQLRFSFHEYFSAVPTSGMGGKLMDTATAKAWSPESPLPDKALRWWHCGRFFDFGFAYLDSVGLPHPPMVITELGMATMSDQKAWLQTLKKTPPYQDTSNGWLTMSNQFREWWPDISPARRYAQMIAWLDRNLYAPNNVPVIVYCYGADPNRPPGSEQDWLPFSVENEEFMDELAKAQAVTSPPPPSPPVVVTYPDPVARPAVTGVPAKMVSAAAIYANVRQGPGTQFRDIGDVFPGCTGTIYRDSAQSAWVWFEADPGQSQWKPGDSLTTGGWVATTAATFEDVVITPPAPPAPPPEALYSPWLSGTEIQQLAELHTKIAAIFQAAYDRTLTP